jgi:hypothetical protein
METLNQWADEALANGTLGTNPGDQSYFKGLTVNGLKFEGWPDPLNRTSAVCMSKCTDTAEVRICIDHMLANNTS